ncbi:MAG TPA: cytochrome c [Granulicella sp.]
MNAKRAMISLGLLLASSAYVMQVRAAGSLYTAEQAKRGEALYTSKQCSTCHGADLNGLGPTPPLNGDDFFGKYQGQPMSMLFGKIHTTMPATAPGSLAPNEVADLIAYLLSQSKYAAGGTEFPSNGDGLKAPLPKP